jgi:hypothetical protein
LVEQQTFTKRLTNISNEGGSIHKLVDDIYNAIKNNFDNTTSERVGKFIKADLKCVSPLYKLVDGVKEELIGVGDYVEVKKLDYSADSYLSEFFSIYKNPKYLPTMFVGERKEEIMAIYNEAIDKLYLKIKGDDGGILKEIHNSFAGIMYDGNRFIEKKDIYLYWSNKGQRTEDHRLSIRYRINTTNLTTYIYNSESDILTTSPITVKSLPNQGNPKVIHSDFVKPPVVTEATVTDKYGKDHCY